MEATDDAEARRQQRGGSSTSSAPRSIRLNSGYSIPLVGYGTWAKVQNDTVKGVIKTTVLEALRAGYQHIDCAAYYNNESEVGEALAEAFTSGLVQRSELFVTTKLWNNQHEPHQVRGAVEKSLRELRVDYLDLFLMHWPVTGRPGPEVKPSLHETWRAMEDLVRQGLVRSLGVSNFSPTKLASLLHDIAGSGGDGIRPAVCQVEMHPYFRNQALLSFCRAEKIHVTAYSPLGSPDSATLLGRDNAPRITPSSSSAASRSDPYAGITGPLYDPDIQSIAQRLGRSVAQIILRWNLQRGVSVLPKSTNPDRIKANLDLFSFSLAQPDFDAISVIRHQQRMVDGQAFLSALGPYKTYQDLWDEPALPAPGGGSLFLPSLKTPVARLASGYDIPLLGFGTWKAKPGECRRAVWEALACGVRHLDCARVYFNQREVGAALQDAIATGYVSRKDIFLTSKIWNTDHNRVREACEETLEELRVEYLDLLLIHWPVQWALPLPLSAQGGLTVVTPLTRVWEEMERLVTDGLVRSIGVSNFGPRKLAEIVRIAKIPVSVVQSEMHPYFRNDLLRQSCQSNGIHFTAYAPLGSKDSSVILGGDDTVPTRSLLDDPVVQVVAKKHNAVPAQILIAWGMSHGCSVLPKSVSPSRISLNARAVFLRLDQADMDALNALEPQARRVNGEFWLRPGGPLPTDTYQTLDDLWA